ncbi:MAG: heme ABC exporter ATP-binding protein CcmA [Actinomycetota bacterium]
MPPLFSLERVDVSFGSTPVIQAVDCRLAPGECLWIGGPNGAGKTTLLRVIATLLPPTSGDGIVLGARLGSRQVLNVREKIGLAGHQPALTSYLTLAENLTLVAKFRGGGHSEARRALEMVGLAGAADRSAAHCSQGMLRRADLARLFLDPPLLLLLDEPHAGLDESAQPLVEALVDRTVRRGGGAVLVSHDPGHLASLADRRLLLRLGVLETV